MRRKFGHVILFLLLVGALASHEKEDDDDESGGLGILTPKAVRIFAQVALGTIGAAVGFTA